MGLLAGLVVGLVQGLVDGLFEGLIWELLGGWSVGLTRAWLTAVDCRLPVGRLRVLNYQLAQKTVIW